MKNLFVLLVLALSSVAFAGSSDQDPVVAQIRNQYADATKPTLEQLIAHEWNCDSFDAWKDSTNRVTAKFKFAAGPGKLVKAMGSAGEMIYVFSGSELLRTAIETENGRSFSYLIAWRITTDGVLVGEAAIDNSKNIYSPSSDSALTPGYEQFTASSYKICQ